MIKSDDDQILDAVLTCDYHRVYYFIEDGMPNVWMKIKCVLGLAVDVCTIVYTM